MKLHRIVTIAALVGLACAQAAAAGTTDQEGHLLEIQATRAPLAVSGDGAWRLHVDAHDVLHRVSLADPARESTTQLPPGVLTLSVSNDGLKVALATRRQCVGLVDFGGQQDAPAKVSWRPWVLNDAGHPIGAEVAGWVAQMPVDCRDPRVSAPAPAAISSDGKLLATADAVIDGATNRVVASLPTHGANVLQLRFVDHDARVLLATATLGDHDESDPERSGLGVSVWDLTTKSLVNEIEVTDAPLATLSGLHSDFSAQTGFLTWVDERRGNLVQVAPGACGATPRVRAPVGEGLGVSFVVDPYGRWFASSRPLDAAHDASELAAGARWALVVRDMTTGRTLERITSKYALNGLVATPDGATLFALAVQPVEPETGEIVAGWAAVPDAERVLELKLPLPATTATREAAKAWEPGFCKERGETPGARSMARSEHPLKPIWTRELGRTDTLPEADRCSAEPAAPTLIRTADGGFVIDQVSQVAKLDPLTGALALGLPTPRAKNVCSVVTPAGTGFLSATGDTLTWRPLAAATDPAKRRVVERRRGWAAHLVSMGADTVRVVWADPSGQLAVADYDANGKRVREFTPPSTDIGEAGAGDGIPREQRPSSAPCRDARGTPLSIGFDWRAGPFGSQRGVTCGPLPGVARLVWWTGASIAPRADNSAPTLHVRPAIDGAIAVVADEQVLHVVNLALQREIAQVDVATIADGTAWVLASRRLVLVESAADDGHVWLRAYALP